MKGAGFRCEVHTDQDAVGYCCKCGVFLCEECAITAQDPLVYCANCYEAHVGPIPKAAPPAVVEEGSLESMDDQPAPILRPAAYRVEIHCIDGAVKHGTTYSIRPDKRGFFIVPYSSSVSEDEEIQEFIGFNTIKAVFLLKGDSESNQNKSESEYIPEGHEITVQFKDGEIIDGFALGEYDPMVPRFHVIPRDEGNNPYVSVLVERSATESIQLGQVFRAKELRQLIQGPVRKLLLCCYIDNIGAVADIDSIATAIGRTARIVDREIAIFISEGLMQELEGPPNRRVKFMPPSDAQTIKFLSDQDQELHQFYMRQQRLGM